MPRAATLDRNQSALERLEEQQARRVAAAYRQARAEIVDRLISGWTGTDILTPDQAASLLRQLQLLQQVDSRLRALEQELGQIMRGVVNSSSELAIEQMRRELALLPADVRPDNRAMFATINTRMIERFVPVAVQDMRLATGSLSLTIQRELQTGLLQGQSFNQLVRRVMAPEPTGVGTAVWSNGALSAERAVRRAVIASENSAKTEALGEVQREIPQVRKQWMSTISRNTTETCLLAHGQIVDVDEQFTLTGQPRFADHLLAPPAHWNCRSSVVMWHASFESSGLSTQDMRSAARAETRRRENEPERRSRTA